MHLAQSILKYLYFSHQSLWAQKSTDLPSDVSVTRELVEPVVLQEAEQYVLHSDLRNLRDVPSLLDASSEELTRGLEHRLFSSVDLVTAYVARIKEVNTALNAVMEVNPDAWRIAAELDFERTQGRVRGPLHGLPVLIKANIGTHDLMETNAGSLALKDAIPHEDSTVATKLREQGLIILGKTNMAEWAYHRSSNSSHGWNAVSGQTSGAYFPKQCPGASSSGSAVASDLGLAWAVLGTETGGSIIVPSERNNIVGIKPTVGLTSRHLVVPISEHQDTIGPMARTVKDAAKLLQVIQGSDLKDEATLSANRSGAPDFLAACNADGLWGKRIGVARNVMLESSNEIIHTVNAFEDALSVIAIAGATIVPVNFTAYNDLKARKKNPITRLDFIYNLERYLSMLKRNPQNIRNIEDLQEFTRAVLPEEFPLRDTFDWDLGIELNRTHSSLAARAKLYEENLRIGGVGGILGALENHTLDAVALPSVIAFSIPALVGSPIITVPLGQAGPRTPVQVEPNWPDVIETAPGLPVGISFLGHLWSEATLIEIAYAFEQRTLKRNNLERYITPTVDLTDVIRRRMMKS